jgi:hypothetical protein
MSSDDVEASTSDVNSSGDFIDKIIQSVLDSENFNLVLSIILKSCYGLRQMRMPLTEMQKLRMIVLLLMVVLGLIAAHIVFVTSLHIVIAKTMKICVDAAVRADEFVK